MSDVAPDGSPVAVYLALPAEPEFTPVLEAIEEDASVLDLGCGVGRLANVLAARGNRVTGVDESTTMLEHVHPDVETVEARLEDLDLGRRFDAVVLASHLVNEADAAVRRSLLRTTARHVLPTGEIFIEHYDPTRILVSSDAEVGGLHISFRVLDCRGPDFDARVVYRLGDDSWEQTFTATILHDADFDAALDEVGLRPAGRLSATWLVAEQRSEGQAAAATASTQFRP